MTEIFHIVPASARALWIVLGLVGLLLLTILSLIVRTARGAETSSFELSPAGLRIRGDLYGRFIAASQLRGAAAHRLVQTDTGLIPAVRSLGTAMPGYQSGWFRLRNGEKALLYLTDRSRAVYVPTRSGYSLLLSVTEPDRFLERLREVAPGN
jgi:PH (Pleckstrin Homology) domain-containing protein